MVEIDREKKQVWAYINGETHDIIYDDKEHTLIYEFHPMMIDAQGYLELQQLFDVAARMAGMLDNKPVDFGDVPVGTHFKFLNGTFEYVKVGLSHFVLLEEENGEGRGCLQARCNTPIILV